MLRGFLFRISMIQYVYILLIIHIMNKFLKPTKLKMLIFLMVTVVIISILYLIIFFSGYSGSTIIYHFVWLGEYIGSNTNINLSVAGGDYISFPNFLGWILLIIGTLLPFFIYYLIACSIVYFIEKKKIK